MSITLKFSKEYLNFFRIHRDKEKCTYLLLKINYLKDNFL